MVQVPPPASGTRPQHAPNAAALPRGFAPRTAFSLASRASNAPGAKTVSTSPGSGTRPGRHDVDAPGTERPIIGLSSAAGGSSPRATRLGETHTDASIDGGGEKMARQAKEDRATPERTATDDGAALDPLSRSLWCLAPPEHRVFDQAIASPTTLTPPAGTPPAALDDILARMVTRFALSGDKRRGTSHLVVGAGELSGGSVTLEAEGKAVHVRIDAPPGVDARAFGESIRARLEAKGLEPTIELR